MLRRVVPCRLHVAVKPSESRGVTVDGFGYCSFQVWVRCMYMFPNACSIADCDSRGKTPGQVDTANTSSGPGTAYACGKSAVKPHTLLHNICDVPALPAFHLSPDHSWLPLCRFDRMPHSTCRNFSDELSVISNQCRRSFPKRRLQCVSRAK